MIKKDIQDIKKERTKFCKCIHNFFFFNKFSKSCTGSNYSVSAPRSTLSHKLTNYQNILCFFWSLQFIHKTVDHKLSTFLLFFTFLSSNSNSITFSYFTDEKVDSLRFTQKYITLHNIKKKTEILSAYFNFQKKIGINSFTK